MTKADLVEVVAKKANLTNKAARDAVQSVLDGVRDALKGGEKVVLTGFGTFIAKFRSARGGVNPQKPEERIQVPAVTVPKFRAGKTLKDALKAKPV